MGNPIKALFTVFRYLPHIIVYKTSHNSELIDYEVRHWNEVYQLPQRSGIIALVYLLNAYREYRSLFYLRTGAKWLSLFAKGQNNLEFYTPSDKIGKGLVIWHGFSTVINVRSLGEDCQIWQNVTIGKKTSTDYDDRPLLGRGVKVCAGAIVVGEIDVADRVIVGAGAIVTKDVPQAGTVVVSSPSRYIIK